MRVWQGRATAAKFSLPLCVSLLGDLQMTIARHVKHASLALIALSCVGALQGAYANGTPSGPNITNQATADYSGGGVNQTALPRPAASCVVDTRIDFDVVQQNGPVVTQPGQTDVVAEVLVGNTGNSTQGYQLAGVNEG